MVYLVNRLAVVGTRQCSRTVGCRFFQIRSLGKYLLEVGREVPAGAMLS